MGTLNKRKVYKVSIYMLLRASYDNSDDLNTKQKAWILNGPSIWIPNKSLSSIQKNLAFGIQYLDPYFAYMINSVVCCCKLNNTRILW